MNKKIRFFYKTSGDDAPAGFGYFIESDGTVWRDNEQSYESQCAVIGFEDCVMPCPELDWELVSSNAELTGG